MRLSLPVRGAWVEINFEPLHGVEQVRSLPVRGAWVEIFPSAETVAPGWSLPVRGAWVEIPSRRAV